MDRDFITEKTIDNFIKKEKQNKESFMELFPNVDINKFKELFEEEEDGNEVSLSFTDSDTDSFAEFNNIIHDNNLSESGIRKNEIMEKSESDVTVVRYLNINDNNNEKEELKSNDIQNDGNKFIEFFNRRNNNIENNSQNSINNKPFNYDSNFNNSFSYKLSEKEMLNSMLPNTVVNIEKKNYDNSNEDNNSLINDFSKEQHCDFIKKFQNLILKQENYMNNNNKNMHSTATTITTTITTNNNIDNKISNNNILYKNDIFTNESNDKAIIDPDIILSKVKKYGEEMDYIQKEIMNNYRLNSIPYSKSNNDNKSLKNNRISEYQTNINLEPSIEEISLKKDFWKASNLTVSRKNIEKKDMKNNDEISNKAFLKVDNYVTWEE